MSASPTNSPAQYANVVQINNYAEYIDAGPGPISDNSANLIFTIAGWFRFLPGSLRVSRWVVGQDEQDVSGFTRYLFC